MLTSTGARDQSRHPKTRGLFRGEKSPLPSIIPHLFKKCFLNSYYVLFQVLGKELGNRHKNPCPPKTSVYHKQNKQ